MYKEIQEHSEVCEKTAIYPEQVNQFGLAYLTLGLLDEFEELKTLTARWSSSDVLTRLSAQERSEIFQEIIYEFGDVLWYAHNIHKRIALSFAHTLEQCMHFIDLAVSAGQMSCEFTRKRVSQFEFITWLLHDTFEYEIALQRLHLRPEKSLAGLVKKIYRDNTAVSESSLEIQRNVLYLLFQALSEILHIKLNYQDQLTYEQTTWLDVIHQEQQAIINTALKQNCEKLISRQQRAVLQGSGDHR
jgi:hypothetical protein